MTVPVVLSLPGDVAAAERVVDALVEADLRPICYSDAATAAEWQGVAATIARSRCVVLILGPASAEAGPVAEAFRYLAVRQCDQGVAVGVRVAPTVDVSAYLCTIYDFTGWHAAGGVRGWIAGGILLRDIASAAKYKSAGRDPPPAAAPRKLLVRQLAALFSAIVLPIVGLLGFTDVTLGLYGATDFARAPGGEEQRAWNAMPAGDCDALRAFRRRYPDGLLGARARDALASPIDRTRRVVLPRQIPLSLQYLPPEDAAWPTEGAAIDAAMRAATLLGKRQCATAASAVDASVVEVRLLDPRPRCETFAAGHSCLLRADFVCVINEPAVATTRFCRY